MTWQPDICIYHGGCDDGFGAAWAVHQRWGDAVQYVPAGYGRPLDCDVSGKNVLFVDFSLKADGMRGLARQAASVVVLDHHKTAEAELYPWSIGGKHGVPPADLERAHGRIGELLALNRMEGIEPVVAFFDMAKSGARMAWEFCHPGIPLPPLLAHVEDRDLWRFALPATRGVSAALRTHPHDFAVWNGLASNVGTLMSEGGAILRGHEKNVASFISSRYWREVSGHRVPVVNVPYHYASDCADAMLQAEPDAPFAASYFDRGDGRRQWSLRSRDDRLDVSEVAKLKGGGGHRNAAGFEEAAP
jgi:hypothetical protein